MLSPVALSYLNEEKVWFHALLLLKIIQIYQETISKIFASVPCRYLTTFVIFEEVFLY